MKNLVKKILIFCFAAALVFVSCSSPSDGGTGNSETSNSGTGNGEAGNGEAGNGEAGNGEAGNGEAGNGEAGNGEAGNGEAGNGEAGNGEAGNGEAGNGRALVSNKIGKYGAPYEVGDIVFLDGSATPYEDFLGPDGEPGTEDDTITDYLKIRSEVVIFYKGTGLNNDVDGAPDNKTIRTLGIGLRTGDGKYSDPVISECQWCHEDADAHNRYIETISCHVSVSDGVYTITGDKNGSDNLKQIADFVNTQIDESKYYAFNYCKNYEIYPDEEEFKHGWYLPSIAELYEIYKQRDFINNIMVFIEGTQLESETSYWSSSQYESDNGEGPKKAYLLWFSNGEIFPAVKSTNYYSFRAIHEF